MGGNTIFGGPGELLAHAGRDNDLIYAGTRTATLVAHGGNNALIGGSRDNTICARVGVEDEDFATYLCGNNYVQGCDARRSDVNVRRQIMLEARQWA